MIIRVRYVFYGRVQGVGFRYTAWNAALALGITGFVRNEDDGSVTVEAQGETTSLLRFLEMLNSGRWISIDRIRKEKCKPDPDEHAFRIEGGY
jgi:acylphosphatase